MASYGMDIHLLGDYSGTGTRGGLTFVVVRDFLDLARLKSTLNS